MEVGLGRGSLVSTQEFPGTFLSAVPLQAMSREGHPTPTPHALGPEHSSVPSSLMTVSSPDTHGSFGPKAEVQILPSPMIPEPAASTMCFTSRKTEHLSNPLRPPWEDTEKNELSFSLAPPLWASTVSL